MAITDLSLLDARLALLDRMIASGVLTTESDGVRVTYRSMAELKEGRAHVAKQIALASTETRPRRRVVMTTRSGF